MPEYLYYALGPIFIFIMLTMFMHVQNNQVLSAFEVKWFGIVFAVLALELTCEYLCILFEKTMVPTIFPTAVNVLQFAIAPFIPVFLAHACSIQKGVKEMGILMCIQAAAQVIMSFFGGCFYYAADNSYHRGPYYMVYIAIYFISFIYMIAVFFWVGQRFEHKDSLMIASITLVAVASAVLTVCNGLIRVGVIGPVLTATLLYIYYEDLSQQNLLADIREKSERINVMQHGTIMGMATMIESRDGSTGEHVKNTARYVEILAKEALKRGLYPETITENFVEQLIKAAPMHDIGKIAISDTILNKPGRFTDEEYAIMKSHTTEGGRIIDKVLEGLADREYINIAQDVALFHHEKWDGTGYPSGLKGEEIPLAARIMAIADVYDALVAVRVYKAPMPREKVLGIIEKDAGTHFDPILAPVFVEIMK